MSITRKRAGLAIAATITAGALALVTATSAQAVIPAWPTGGFHPHCDAVGVAAGGPTGFEFNYTDSTSPTFAGYAHPTFVRLTNTPAKKTLGTLRLTDACGGSLGAELFYTVAGTATLTVATTPGPNFFDARLAMQTPAVNATSAGAYAVLFGYAFDRYDSFVLSSDFKTLLSSVTSSHAPRGTDQYTGQKTYLLRDTTLSIAKNRTSMKKGTAVTVAGTLKIATGSSYDPMDVTRVYLQRRYVGSSTWATVGNDISDGAGRVGVSNVPARSAYYRLVYNGRYASPWNAPRTSAATALVTVK